MRQVYEFSWKVAIAGYADSIIQQPSVRNQPMQLGGLCCSLRLPLKILQQIRARREDCSKPCQPKQNFIYGKKAPPICSAGENPPVILRNRNKISLEEMKSLLPVPLSNDLPSMTWMLCHRQGLSHCAFYYGLPGA